MIVYGTPDDAKPAERLDWWRHFVGQAFVPMDARPPGDREASGSFHGRIHLGTLGGLQVSAVTAAGHSVSRTPRLIADLDREFYQINVQVSGECAVVKDGRTDILVPGDLAILDSSEVYQLLFDGDHQVLCFTLPRRLVPFGHDQAAQVTATRVNGAEGTAALLVPFLRRLAGQVFAHEVDIADRLARNVVDLTETLLLERTGELPATRSEAPRRLLRLRICDDIRRRLASPDLSPAELAARHHISVRYLHRLFEEGGVPVSQWIRDQRLQRARQDLSDPALDRVPVAVIGARWGLPAPSQFNRQFKARFGLTPGQYRRERPAEQEPTSARYVVR
jgi:AraC-like DNA-binding protein